MRNSHRVGYVLGLAGNQVLLGKVAALAEDAALGRVNGEGEKVRRFGEFRYAAKSWKVERRVIGRVEASSQGSDSRFVITNLAGTPRWLYEQRLLCPRPGREFDQGAQAAPLLQTGPPAPARRPISSLLIHTAPTGSCTRCAAWRRRPRSGVPPSSTPSVWP